MKEFKPVVRIAVMSDVHYKNDHTVERERFEKALDAAYAYGSSEEYKNIDALFIVGDFANSGTEPQMQALKDSVDRKLKSETELVLTLASHEFGDSGIVGALEKLDRIFGKQPDTHLVINGFHFIAMSPSVQEKRSNDFLEDKRLWMLDRLEQAAADNPKAPIFTFQHPHIPNTVYGSVRWANDYLTGLYDQYPQVINFSGHSHAPVNDPRSIHQLMFTSLGLGSLSYFELDEFDKIYGTVPPDAKECAQFLIVEAAADNSVRIKPYDILTGRFFDEVWTIETPADRASFTYTPEKRNADAVPSFESGAALAVKDITADGCTVVIPQARAEGGRTNDYDILVREKATGKTVRRFAVWAKAYLNDMPEAVEQDFGGLSPETEYEISVYPGNFYGIKNKTGLSAAFRTEKVKN